MAGTWACCVWMGEPPPKAKQPCTWEPCPNQPCVYCAGGPHCTDWKGRGCGRLHGAPSPPYRRAEGTRAIPIVELPICDRCAHIDVHSGILSRKEGESWDDACARLGFHMRHPVYRLGRESG